MARRHGNIEHQVSELDLPNSYRKAEWCGEYKLYVSRSKKHVVLGYLVYDSNCENPLVNCEGMGKILPINSWKAGRSSAANYSHLGRDSQGDPELEIYLPIVRRLAGVTEGEESDRHRDMALALWNEADKRGEAGTPYARALTSRHHGGYYETSKSTLIEAVWIPDEELLAHLESFKPGEERKEKANDCFESALEEFNRWAEGDCYGYIVEHFIHEEGVNWKNWKMIDEESVWGFIGSEYAQEELQDAFNRFVKPLRKPNRHWLFKHFPPDKQKQQNFVTA